MSQSAERSAPQPIGRKMAIDDLGRVSGAASGGCVEGAVVQVAEGIINGEPPRLLRFGIADQHAWDVVSEIVALEQARTGGRLIDSGGRIHDATVA